MFFIYVLSGFNYKKEKKLANIEIFKKNFNVIYFTYKNFINLGNYINKGYTILQL